MHWASCLVQPVHRLMGGAVRDEIAYFGFVQGDGPEEVARMRASWPGQGFEVIYLKVGRGDELDVANARAVRAAIGGRRLRLDANEAWDTLTARRMIAKLMAFGPEFLEQPSPAESPAALARLRRVSPCRSRPTRWCRPRSRCSRSAATRPPT